MMSALISTKRLSTNAMYKASGSLFSRLEMAPNRPIRINLSIREPGFDATILFGR
jgi:hypothetical protein